MTACKIEACRSFLGLALGLLMGVIASITGCASGPLSSNLNQSPPYHEPTWSGDDHTPSVYTSPTVAPATNNLANTHPD